MILTKDIKLSIKKHALREEPNECCGLIYESEEGAAVKECENLSPDKSRHFIISPRNYLEATMLGRIKASYHSHTNKVEEFSVTDKLNSQRHNIDYILYNTVYNTFRVYNHKKNSIVYADKKFIWGKQDCISLIQNYLKEKINFNLELPECLNSRSENWAQKNPNAATQAAVMNSDSLQKINPKSVEDIQENDILCFYLKQGSMPPYDHFAVCPSAGEMFHHIWGGYPVTQSITKFYFNKIVDVYRYIK